MYSFNLNRDVLDYVIEGFVAKQFFEQEVWAHLFMTAVLDPAVAGEEFKVESVKDRIYNDAHEVIEDDIPIFATFTEPNVILRCGNDATCIERIVKWEAGPIPEYTQRYLPIVFRTVLSG